MYEDCVEKFNCNRYPNGCSAHCYRALGQHESLADTNSFQVMTCCPETVTVFPQDRIHEGPAGRDGLDGKDLEFKWIYTDTEVRLAVREKGTDIWYNSPSLIGPQGEQGEKGEQGERGPKGDAGMRGIQGPKGEQGEQGPQGLTGPRGATGPQGPRGETGSQGPKGDTGERGPQGLKGEVGPQGPQGVEGPRGPQGYTPYVGDNNHWFINGVDTGINVSGLLGPQGPQGEKGDKGDKGDVGDTPFIGENGTWWISGVDTGVAVSSSYVLPTASPNALGGVKVGSNLSIAADGTLSALVPDVDLSDYYNKTQVDTALNNKAPSEHTHNYAGSDSVGGAANGADKVNIFRSASDGYFPLLLTNSNANGQDKVYAPTGNTVTLNPGTGAVKATKFEGVLTGTADYANNLIINTIPANADLNSYTTSGRYAQFLLSDAKTLINNPLASAETGILMDVIKLAGDVFVQILYGVLTGGIYKRRSNSGVWSDWIRMATYDEATNLSNMGITATAAELNYVTGVTSNLQTQLNGKAPTTHNHTVSQITDLSKSSIGLGNVENKSSATIRGELTSANVTTALTFTPAKESHNQTASTITSGTFPSGIACNTPTAGTHIANKSYVDSVVSNVGNGVKVLEASTSNIIDFNTFTETGVYLIKNILSTTTSNAPESGTNTKEMYLFVMSMNSSGTIRVFQKGMDTLGTSLLWQRSQNTSGVWGEWSRTIPAGSVTSGTLASGVSCNAPTSANHIANKSYVDNNKTTSLSAGSVTAGTLAGQVNANATAEANVGTTQVRNISAGTADLTAGTSALTTGEIYFVYE